MDQWDAVSLFFFFGTGLHRRTWIVWSILGFRQRGKRYVFEDVTREGYQVAVWQAEGQWRWGWVGSVGGVQFKSYHGFYRIWGRRKDPHNLLQACRPCVCVRGSASGKSGYGRWRARTENPAPFERENNYGRSKEGDLRGVRGSYVRLPPHPSLRPKCS
jgi:hypothetical protein